MLDANVVSENLIKEIDDLVVEIADRMLGQNLPFVADLLLSQSSKLLGVMDELKTAIETALESAGEIEAGELANIINSIELDGQGNPIVAKEDEFGNLILFFDVADVTAIAGLDLDAGASIGLSAGAFDVAGEVATDITLDANFAILVDVSTGDVEFAPDEFADEITMQINGEINFDIAADNALGFLDIELSENEPFDPEAPKDDLDILLGLDLKSGGQDSTVSMDGRATLDFNFMAGAPDIRVLPEFGANVFVEVSYTNSDLSNGDAADGDFTIELRDVVFKLEALAGVLQDVFSTVSDILNTFPIGEIVDLLVKRLPVVDDLAPSAFDFDEDGQITLQDVITLISLVSPNGLPPAFGLIQGVILLAEVIDAVDELATGLAEDGCFDIGTLRLTSDALDTISNGASFPESARLISSEDSDLQNLADLVEAFGAFNDFINLDEAVEEENAAAAAADLGGVGAAPVLFAASTAAAEDEGGPFDVPEVGLSFPFLESPAALANSLGSLILNGAGAPAVTLIEFDLPPLEFDVYDEIGIRFGPFVGYLFGTFYAGVDINIGYDTAGFGDNFDFLEGLFISPDLPEVEINGETKTPVGTVSLGVGVGGGLDIVIARVAVEGGLLGTIDVFLGGTGPGDNKARLSELGGCFFNDIAGRLTAGIDLVFRFGFGIFSFEKKQSLATVTLAQFNIDPCNPKPNEILDELEVTDAALASDQGDGTLLLHVGDEADMRNLSDEADAEFDDNGNRVGRAERETFFVGLVPEDENNPAAPGEVAVFAFGIFQRLGNGTTALERIVGAGGSKDDVLTVSASVNLDAELSGGAGNDSLVGGGGDDLLMGDEGNDQLDGDLGNDDLRGGSGNDILRGGAGADDIDGGADFDQVDFSQSSQGVTLIESASTPGLMLGFGGEAQGDRVRNVEHFIGSAFDDTFYGNRDDANVFEAGAGDDVLVGGIEGDLFIGGLGADVMSGNRAGEANTEGDAASYVFSTGGVFINLPLGTGSGGEAQGDVFYGIEDFQLSRHADRFIGDSADNLVDGYDGDDELEGGAGRDTVLGGVGDDIVYALGDGDDLDGGGFLNYRPDTDLLSYEKAGGDIIASLYSGSARLRSNLLVRDDIGFAQYIGFNSDGENVILSRDGSTNPRTSSFENLTGSSFDDDLTGDDQANEIRGGSGADDIDGRGGNDLLIGEAGADALDGGDGLDTADYTESNQAVRADLNAGIVGIGGHAQGDTFENVENLIGSRYEDILIGDDGDNRLDPFRNEFGAVEVLVGNDGVDTGVLDYSSDTSGAAYVVFLNSGGNGQVRRTPDGSTTSQTIVSLGTLEQVEFLSGDGDDFLTTRITGNDIINTGGGNDAIDAWGGSDRVFAGTGDDTVVRLGDGSVVNQRYVGAGETLRETFILDGGRGIDGLLADISYTQQDILWLADAPDGTESTRSLVLEGGGVIRNFEVLAGLITGAGNDFVGQLGDVSSIFSTGAGADTVTVGLGIDIAEGGSSGRNIGAIRFEDVDTLIVDYSGQAGQVVNVTDPTGADAVYDGVIRLVAANATNQVVLAQVRHVDFERILLTGTGFGDHLVGSDNTYFRIGGDTPGDILIGGLGNDLIEGLAGDDTLRGGEGRDTLEGGDGDDILIGADRGGLPDDQDTLTGGRGADRFVFGDASGTFYDGVEDGATITDFSTAEGDVIQLAGGPGNYSIEVFGPVILGSGSFYQILVSKVDPVTGAETRLISMLSDASLSLTDDAFEYVGTAARAVSFAAPLEISEDIAASPELTGWLWQSGAVDDEVLLSSVREASVQSLDAPIVAASATAASTILAEDVLQDASSIIGDAIDDFAVPLLELDNFTLYTSVTITGDAAASGTFRDMFGLESGIVLSTGRVDNILGENTNDGRFALGPRPASEQVLEFETLGALEGGTLYRALVPDVPGGIQSMVLQDDADLLGGAPGFFTAFDLDALFFSEDLITTTAGLSRADVNALNRLGVIEYSAAGITLDPGTQRPGGFQQADLAGTVNGMIDFDLATLDSADWNNANDQSATGFLSLGDGGSLSLNLDAPVNSTSDDPTYLYLYEIGGQESLEGVARVSAQVIGVEGDLSTDLGAPGIQDDSTKMTATFFVDYSGKAAEVPDFAELSEVPFFDVVIISEELPERGGADLPDLISVKVNGVDVLRDASGSAVTMNTLAFSPYGDYADELTLNLVGEGPLVDHLRADAYTSVYRISGPVVNGENTIEVEVADRADALLDTAIFIAPIAGGVPLNQAPVARNDSLRLSEDEVASVNLITDDGTDTDSDGDDLIVTSAQLLDANGDVLQELEVGDTTVLDDDQGMVTLSKTGEFTFDTAGQYDELAADTFSLLSFAYTVSDGVDSDAAKVSVIVDGTEPPNDAPVFKSDREFETFENTRETFRILALDSDGPDPIVYGLSSRGDADLFQLDAENGALRFLAAPDFEAPGDADGDNVYELRVTASDGINTVSQTIAVTVQNVVEPCDGLAKVMGDGKDNILRATTEGECFETGDGRDQIIASFETIKGDVITDFSKTDVLRLEKTPLGPEQVRVKEGSAEFFIEQDGEEVSFTFLGDFSGQAFEVTSDGTDTTIALAGAGASQLSATGERFITTDGGENRVYGDLGDDVILSAGGADILSGGAGDDTLLGGNDDDILLGGLGNDTMTGGAGRDIFAIDASDFSAGFNSNFITDFTPGEDILELTGFGFNDFSGLSQQNVVDGVLIRLESSGLISLNGLSLGDLGADDVSFGDAGRSYGLVSTTVVHRLTEEADRFLTTDPAANEVRAGGGDDVVIGAGGADVIYGEAGGDVLLGGAGADILQGGAGFDTLTGGADADQFVFEAGEETEFGLDVITDFTVGEDVVVATGFGLNATSFDAFTVTEGGLTAQLAHNQFVVFQGITEVSGLGDLNDAFNLG